MWSYRCLFYCADFFQWKMHERGRNEKSRPGKHPVFLAVFNHNPESQSKLAKILLRNKSAIFVIRDNEYGVINSSLGHCCAPVRFPFLWQGMGCWPRSGASDESDSSPTSPNSDNRSLIVKILPAWGFRNNLYFFNYSARAGFVLGTLMRLN